MKNNLFIMSLFSITTVLLLSACGGGKQKSSAEQLTDSIKTESKQAKSNGVFEIISCSGDSVKFKAVAETQFYSLALVSGEQTVEAQAFSNTEDTVHWANGSMFWPGSSMSLPAAFGIGAMTLPAGTVMKIYDFSVPENFKAEKIRIITEGTNEMFYNLLKSSWE
jgi:hypothetical protein